MTRPTERPTELPDTVDADRDSGLLEKYGIDIHDLMEHLPGGLVGGSAADRVPLRSLRYLVNESAGTRRAGD